MHLNRFLRSLAIFGTDNFYAVSVKITAGLLACPASCRVAKPLTQDYQALRFFVEFQMVTDCGFLCVVFQRALHAGDRGGCPQPNPSTYTAAAQNRRQKVRGRGL